jgi:hypothetical protein
MSGPVEYDPDELDRAAAALVRVSDHLKQESRQVRSTFQGMSRFRGSEADRVRVRADQYAKAIDRMSSDLDEEAKGLRRLAQAVRSLPRR